MILDIDLDTAMVVAAFRTCRGVTRVLTGREIPPQQCTPEPQSLGSLVAIVCILRPYLQSTTAISMLQDLTDTDAGQLLTKIVLL